MESIGIVFIYGLVEIKKLCSAVSVGAVASEHERAIFFKMMDEGCRSKEGPKPAVDVVICFCHRGTLIKWTEKRSAWPVFSFLDREWNKAAGRSADKFCNSGLKSNFHFLQRIWGNN